jgi:hypothetical protein
MLDLNWKFLVPTSLATIVVTILVDKLIQQAGLTNDWVRTGLLFLANLVLALLVFALLSASARRQRATEEPEGLGHSADHHPAGDHGALAGAPDAHRDPAAAH